MSQPGHIELIGPAGAGKTTVHSILTANDKFYGGTDDNAYNRCFNAELSVMNSLLYGIIPMGVQNHLNEKMIAYRYRYKAFEDFTDNNPKILSLYPILKECGSRDPELLFKIIKRAAERYQLAEQTRRSNEVLVLDESFMMRAASILWRTPEEDFPIENYFDMIPMPDAIINIQAPDKVCISRQEERGDLVIDQCWTPDNLIEAQKLHKKSCEMVVSQLQDSCNIINVVNDGNIESTTNTTMEILIEFTNSKCQTH